MACDHVALRASVEAFEAGTTPVLRDGVQALQYGARLADCRTCPPGRESTFIHPGDAHKIDEYFDAQEAA